MLEILTTAADAASGSFTIGDLMKILGWVTAFVSMVMGYVFHARAKAAQDQAKAAEDQVRKLRLEPPVPEVPVAMRKVPGVPSWNDHGSLVDRVARLEGHVDKMRDEQAKQYRSILESGANRQAEIVKQLSDKIDDVAVEWHRRLDTLFTKAPRRER